MFCPYCINIFSRPLLLGQYYSVGTPQRLSASSVTCEFCWLLVASSAFNVGDQNQEAFIQWSRDGFLLGTDGVAIVPISPTKPSLSPQGVARKAPSRLRTRMLRDWYANCEGHSSHRVCHPVNVWDNVRADTSPTKLQKLRLVYIPTMRLKSFIPSSSRHRNIKYAILSYAQQKLKHPKVYRADLPIVSAPGGLYNLPRPLPQTYLDVIDIARRLGFRYVWIDRLSILQDSFDTSNAVRNMDRIYQGASLTIIASDGKPKDDIKAVHNGPRQRYYTQWLPTGVEWAVQENVYTRLASSVYMSRGWTYQELVLSHRLLVFIDGQAFFLCRRRMFSEDSWWDQFPRRVPLKNTRFWNGRIPEFMPRTSNDPLELYQSSLAEYRSRDIGENDVLKAFNGVLTHLTRMMNTTYLYGLPRSQLDIVLVWWHAPEINEGNTICRVDKTPSWSWAGWRGGTPINFLPPTSVNRRNKWLKKNDPQINFWFKNAASNTLSVVWTDRLENRLTSTNPGYRRPGFSSTPRPPLLVSYLRNKWALSFQAWMLPMGSAVVAFYPWGRGELLTRAGEVVGIIYADELLSTGVWDSFRFVVLYRSKRGDQTFNNGRLRAFPRPDGFGMTTFPKIRADGLDLFWVMMIAWDPLGFWERKGMGFIATSWLYARFVPLERNWIFLH